MNAEENNEEKFSDDPEEHMKIENELLKLKLSAELGGTFEALSEIPPAIENEFLKNVLAFEHAHANSTDKTVFEVLGQPEYKKSAEVADDDLSNELGYIKELLQQHFIEVDYLCKYSDRIKYQFLTEELFQHESSMFAMPGMTMHYTYEEFHPNHKYDINSQSERFFTDWVEMNFNEYSNELASVFLLPDGSEISNEAVREKIGWMHTSFTAFTNTTTNITNIQFNVSEHEEGNGFCEGNVSYEAVLENGEQVHFNGLFKLFFKLRFDLWQINYFTWPGFSW